MSKPVVVVPGRTPVEAHPGLIVTTYRVNSTTGETTQPATRELRAVEPLPPCLAWPPCACPRHRDT
jgi:hypothetical protein